MAPSPFESFMDPQTSQWVFLKPNPSSNYVKHISATTKAHANIIYAATASCTDDTGSRYLQGFIQTLKPVDNETLTTLFGCAIFTPCFFKDDEENIVLTEILMDRSLREFGDSRTTKKKSEIELFKQDADKAMDHVVTYIRFKQLTFVRDNPHLVLRYFQTPHKAPKLGYPESFVKDADLAMSRAMGTTGEKHPGLLRDYPRSVIRYLVS